MAGSSEDDLKRTDCDTVPSAEEPYLYTRWYCEENIFQFLQNLSRAQKPSKGQLWAVFLSNPNQQVTACLDFKVSQFMEFTQKCERLLQLPLCGQKSGDPDLLDFICYDYHVIAVETFANKETIVYDFDRSAQGILSWRHACVAVCNCSLLCAMLPAFSHSHANGLRTPLLL